MLCASAFLATSSDAIDAIDEEQLLSYLSSPNTDGIIITGGGGLGKTRLTIEIGRIAQEKDWQVFRVQGRVREQAIHDLFERITPLTNVLFLIDYLETFGGFERFTEVLAELNNTGDSKFRYIANCRTSYYTAVAATSNQKRVDLSPPSQDQMSDWFIHYQQQVVRPHQISFQKHHISKN